MSQPTETYDPRDPSRPPALPDLPPVEAPSAGFIVQLFVIPAVIVAVVIVVWLLFGKLAGGERDAMEYVRLLRSPNANWRAAHELASLIQNDPKLARDPKLLGELTDLLGHELDQNENPQLTQYVTLTLGAFQTLDARTAAGKAIDPLATLARALGASQPAEVRFSAALSLAKQAARLDGALDDPKTVAALADAAEHGEVELRQMAVYALGFCGGDGATSALRARLDDEDRFVRYNAALALGRRGDPAALTLFREMLSSPALNKAITLESESEKRTKIETIQLEALQTLDAILDKRKSDFAASLRPEVATLSQSGLVSVRNRALSVLKKLPPAA